MIDFIQLASTTHAYAGGNSGTGPESIDGDFGTYYGNSGGDFNTGSGGSFAGGATVYSTHTFSIKRTIKEIAFKIYTATDSSSSTDNAHHSQYKVQYQVEGDATWYDFAGATGSNGSFNPGTVDLTGLNVQNVVAVRAYVSNGGSFHNDDGQHTWDLRIYELQAFGDQQNNMAVAI